MTCIGFLKRDSVKTLTKAKLRAGGIHLGISLVILLILVPYIYFAWYPQPYFIASGGLQGSKLLAAIVLVLGPVITLIAFNPAKSRKALLIDSSFILVVQLAALLWGIYAVHSQRPVVVAYNEGIFQAVTADAFSEQDKETLDFSNLSNTHPPLVFSREPENMDEKKGIVMFRFVAGISKHELAYLYEPLPANMDKLLEQRASQLDLLRNDRQASQKLDALLTSRGMNPDDILAIQFIGRYGYAWMVLSSTGELIDVI